MARKDSGKGRTDGPKRSEKRKRRRKGAAPAQPTTAATPTELAEHGSFAHARCRCGWEGPGRRSRDRARRDLDKHLADHPKHVDRAEVTGP